MAAEETLTPLNRGRPCVTMLMKLGKSLSSSVSLLVWNGIMIKAVGAAKKSSYKHQMGACITKGNKVLGVGYNRTNRHQSKIKTTHWPGSYHAETAAVIDALRKHTSDKLKGAKITVVRLGKKNQLMLALPCRHCYNMLKNLGIKEVRFSNDSGGFTSMRF